MVKVEGFDASTTFYADDDLLRMISILLRWMERADEGADKVVMDGLELSANDG